MTQPEPETYVAKAPCGCVKMLAVDAPGHERETAKEVAWCIRKGYSISRVATAAVRTTPGLWPSSCEQCNPKRAKRKAQAQQEALDL